MLDDLDKSENAFASIRASSVETVLLHLNILAAITTNPSTTSLSGNMFLPATYILCLIDGQENPFSGSIVEKL